MCSIFDKLIELEKKIIYVPPNKLKINTVYKLLKLERGKSGYDSTQPAMIAHIHLTDDVSEWTYLPASYLKGEKALSHSDMGTIHAHIADHSAEFYVVCKGRLAGTNDIVIVSVADSKPLATKFKYYDGKYILLRWQHRKQYTCA